jgi:hypothetical protein
MSEDAVFQIGKRMLHNRASKLHGLCRGPFVHALRSFFMQMPCDQTPGTCRALRFERAGSIRIRLTGVDYGAIFPLFQTDGEQRSWRSAFAWYKAHKKMPSLFTRASSRLSSADQPEFRNSLEVGSLFV